MTKVFSVDLDSCQHCPRCERRTSAPFTSRCKLTGTKCVDDGKINSDCPLPDKWTGAPDAPILWRYYVE